jgi:VIT1/CCC1 family predicted Fe2+/Mn2+ transporter
MPAGRACSRSTGRKTISQDDLRATMAGVGYRDTAALVDEIPTAYQVIDQVMTDAADLVEVRRTLHQLIDVKGDGAGCPCQTDRRQRAGGGQMAGSGTSVWRGLRARLKGPTVQAWVVEANDGIIATAGLLEGFAGAGAGDQLLITAALAATIAGALSVGGAKWAEAATERDAQLATVAYEQRLLAANPEDELAELAEHYVGRGLTPDLAQQVAEQLHAADPLSAQLQTEYGIDEIPPARAPALTGLGGGLSFAVGSSIPLLITFVAPISLDAIAVLIAVVVSLTITSIIVARSAYLSARRTIVRTLIVGLSTMGVSYVAGLALLPPTG